jgi:hypothetical protein
VLSRRHVVAIATVISVVLITLTAWGHKHTSGGRVAAATGPSSTSAAQSSPAQTTPAPASSVSASSAGRTPATSPSKPRVTVGQLTAGLQSLFGPGDSFSVAGFDLTTGRSIAAGAGAGMTEASIVKLDILETALYHRQQTGYDFSEDDAEAMMESSDNAAGDRIFDYDGGNSGLQPYNDTVGLGSTQLDPTETWGLSTTTATDQLILLKQLVSGTSVLNSTSRAYALQLMGDVEADQNWGISAAADPGATSWLKNGWLNIDRDNGLWAVNSIGMTTSGGHRVLLAVLSQHQPDMQTGVNRVATAAKQLAAALHSV